MIFIIDSYILKIHVYKKIYILIILYLSFRNYRRDSNMLLLDIVRSFLDIS